MPFGVADHDAHNKAVSVSLPTWKANVGYEEGQDWVLSKMKTGYPRLVFQALSFTFTVLNILPRRFFIHKSIEAFAQEIIQRHGSPTEQAFLFPSSAVSARCVQFLKDQIPPLTAHSVRIIDLYPNAALPSVTGKSDGASAPPIVSAVLFPQEHEKIAKIFWQHSGDGISSRRAEYCHHAFSNDHLAAKGFAREKTNGHTFDSPSKGPRRYRKKDSVDMAAQKTSDVARGHERKDSVQFVEERFGRNLDVSLAGNAKLAIRRRIAGALTANVDLQEALKMSKPPTRNAQVEGFSEDDVYLYPCGMSAIFNTHRTMMACRGPRKSISYGYALLANRL